MIVTKCASDLAALANVAYVSAAEVDGSLRDSRHVFLPTHNVILSVKYLFSFHLFFAVDSTRTFRPDTSASATCSAHGSSWASEIISPSPPSPHWTWPMGPA